MMMSRRRLLQMLGVASAGSLLPSLGGRAAARADTAPIPRRIVFFYTEQGTLKRAWRPTLPNGAPDAAAITAPWSTDAHTLGELHRPLEAFKDRLLFLDGLDMASSFVDPTGPANAHINGETHALVGSNRASSVLAGGPSIDQAIAKAINTPAPVTRIPSLELNMSRNGNDTGAEARPVYASSGEPVPVIGSPTAVYDRMFPNGPVGSTPEDRERLARSIARDRSVLTFTKDEFKSLAARASKVDRERLEAHASAVSDLAGRIALAQNATCLQPDRTLVAGTGWNQYELNTDAMLRLTQTALACNLTRVVTVYYGEPPAELFGYESVGGTSDFHDMVHKTAAPADVLYNDARAVEIVKRYYVYLAGQFAKLLALLDSIPEADGGTLLDHTLVVWCGQIAGGDHSVHELPYVLAGRMGGAVKSGRYVRYPRVPDKDFWPAYARGPAHNDLFVSLANMMGAPMTTFGNAAVCKGPLAGLT